MLSHGLQYTIKKESNAKCIKTWSEPWRSKRKTASSGVWGLLLLSCKTQWKRIFILWEEGKVIFGKWSFLVTKASSVGFLKLYFKLALVWWIISEQYYYEEWMKLLSLKNEIWVCFCICLPSENSMCSLCMSLLQVCFPARAFGIKVFLIL